MRSFKESMKESIQHLMNAMEGKIPTGITTGFTNLDQILRGMNKGSLTVLASRPSLGKTAFAMNIVKNLMQAKEPPRILFISDLSHHELTYRFLAIASGTRKKFESEYNAEEFSRLTSAGTKYANIPLFFAEQQKAQDSFFDKIKVSHTESRFELIITDNISAEHCRKWRSFAKEVDIPVLALVSTHSKKDDILIRGAADQYMTLHRERKAEADPDFGVPVEVIVSKNNHGLSGTCRMYFIPQIMLFKESCVNDEAFVVIPEIYESVTPGEELKKYISQETLPLLEHLHSEIPETAANSDPDSLLRLSARLEAVGDHENAVKVFKMGQKLCEGHEEKIECVYDLLHAAMYYWLFRMEYKMHGCMARAEQMLDEHSQKEYDELKRRILTYKPSSWIKEEDLEDPNRNKFHFHL